MQGSPHSRYTAPETGPEYVTDKENLLWGSTDSVLLKTFVLHFSRCTLSELYTMLFKVVMDEY